MLNEEICKLRDELNECILTEKNYNEVYKLSVKLDELIAKYYMNGKSSSFSGKKWKVYKHLNIKIYK